MFYLASPRWRLIACGGGFAVCQGLRESWRGARRRRAGVRRCGGAWRVRPAFDGGPGPREWVRACGGGSVGFGAAGFSAGGWQGGDGSAPGNLTLAGQVGGLGGRQCPGDGGGWPEGSAGGWRAGGGGGLDVEVGDAAAVDVGGLADVEVADDVGVDDGQQLRG